jgi:predicted phage terminase large subunit-like protein
MVNLHLTLPKIDTGPFRFGDASRARPGRVPPLDRWLPLVTPTYHWDWPYLVHIRQHLDRITRGEIDRLMIFVPPQHGKSSLVTVRYPVWRLEQNPRLRVILAAYNQTRANEFSREARRLAAQRFPLHKERSAVEEWQTTAGGSVRAVGVGSGVTGRSGDLILIDDPTKSREEAESAIYRDRVYGWFRSDLYTRLQPLSALVLIMTRWHEDDLAGRILASEDGPNWTVISLPAEAEAGDPLGRAIGEPLCPARFDLAALQQIRSVLGTYAYTSLYQGAPLPAGGGMFKREWFEIVEAAPAQCTRVRAWDKAGTEGGGDYSAGAKVTLDESSGLFYVEDVVRGQWSALGRERIMRQTAELDGTAVDIVLEQEPGSGGLESAQASIRNLAGFYVTAEKVTGDKATRAMPWAAQCEAGNVRIVRGAWNAAFLDELCSFPYGAHDDQVDAGSAAFNRLALAPRLGMAWDE